MKLMADISRIVDLYDLYKSYRRVARELRISRNTVKKYVLKVKEVQDGLAVSMAIQKSPVMAMRFPQVYLRLFHFAAQA